MQVLDFSNPYVWLSLNSALSIFALGFYVLFKNRQSVLNRLFSLYTFATALWVFFSYFLMNASLVTENAWHWSRIGAIGGVFIAPSLLIFTLFFTKNKWADHVLTYTVLFGTALILYVWMMEISPIDPRNLIKTQWGWDVEGGMSFPVTISWVWSNFLQMIAFFLYWRFYKKTKDLIQKQRTLLIIIGIMIPAVIAFATEIILPLLKVENIIVIHFFNIIYSLSAVLLVIVIGYAILKYKLFTFLTPSTAAGTIIETITDPLIVTNPDMSIEFINTAAYQLLGYKKGELIDKQIEKIISKENNDLKKFKEKVLLKIEKGQNVAGVEIKLLTKDKKTLPTSFSASIIRDHRQDIVGVAYIARDIRKIRELIDTLEIRVKARTEELEEERKGLAEKVKARTKDLEEKMLELEKFQRLAVGREMKMIELKKEIVKLKEESGK